MMDVGKLELVDTATAKRAGMRRFHTVDGGGLTSAKLPQERLRLLPLILEAWPVRERANLARDRLDVPGCGIGTGHTTSSRYDPCPPRGSEKRLCCHSNVCIGGDHPFPRTGGAPISTWRKSTRAAGG